MVILIGLRGSGKSTVAKLLAHRSGCPAIDLDDHTPARLGAKDAADALRVHGQDAFRLAEFEALRELLATPRAAVLALGGGTPTAPGAAELLNTSRLRGAARVIYLRCSASALRSNLENTDLTTRPSLTGMGVLEEVQQLLELRDPLYRQLADAVIDCDGLTPERIAADISV